MRRASFAFGILLLTALAQGGPKRDGMGLLRILGTQAEHALAPATGQIGALVALPPGKTASAYGLDEVAPGIGRIRASANELLEFGRKHPSLAVETAPPLHLLNDKAGVHIRVPAARARGAFGKNAIVGVADTGIDVKHADFRNADGSSRVLWMLDFSREVRGVHKELESKFQVAVRGKKYGAVYSKAELDQILGSTTLSALPTDENGHGTHVASLAAGNGGTNKKYTGVAPEAALAVVRLTRATTDAIETDDLVRAAQFIFDRADEEGRPAVVNMSLGSDFGPHDGSTLWERAIAANIGSTKPGHIVVAAAGNSGSIGYPVHQSVFVSPNSVMKIPVMSPGGARDGRVQIWITKHRGADLKIGLRGPGDEEWIPPVGNNDEYGKNIGGANAGVLHGQVNDTPIPAGSPGAVVLWSGAWPAGTYNVTLEGEGSAELYLQSYGDVASGSDNEVTFVAGVRSGTINLPASHPSIIGVGCTVNRVKWVALSGNEIGPKIPVLDKAGGFVTNERRSTLDGEVCWFSSAGPSAAGVPKPEIAAPGSGVIGAMSSQALPDQPRSIFTNPGCPAKKSDGSPDPRCMQIDVDHAVSTGTSMSSPIVAGVVALLLDRDPSLTQDQVLALLQAGAHRFRGQYPFQDQSSPGEVDADGSLDALVRMKNPVLALPAVAQSWMTLSVDNVTADGSVPVTVFLELRSATGERADLFDSSRLAPRVTVGDTSIPTSAIVRRGAGLFSYTVSPPPALGGKLMTFGALFDGAQVVTPRTIPIAPDGWRAFYASKAIGGCGTTAPAGKGGLFFVIMFGAFAVWVRRKRARV